MILNRDDYKEFIKVEIPGLKRINYFSLYFYTLNKPCLRFIWLLRTCELYKNTKSNFVRNIIYKFLKFKKHKLGIKLGFSIPENVFDMGLQLPHYGTIVVNGNAKVGKYCRMHVCTNIGASAGSSKAPKIGDYVYIAPGVKIYGDIEIADRIAFAANAAVGKSFLNPGMMVGGVPAKELGPVDIFKIIKFKNTTN